MSSTAIEAREITESYLGENFTLSGWLTTTDHKRIAVLFLISITGFFFVGGIAAGLMRWNLIVPGGMLQSEETYNRLFTMHGVIMVWFFLVPSIPDSGQFLHSADDRRARPGVSQDQPDELVPVRQRRDCRVVCAVRRRGRCGWTFYPTLSTDYSNGWVMVAAAGIFLSGFSSIATGLNFIVTIHTLRAPGMTWTRLPVFVWSHYATSVIYVLATPVLAMTLLLTFFERAFRVGPFDPQYGGDLILFQHLFWFYSHPAVYIMILPGMGVVSEIIPCFCHKKLFGYEFVVWCSIAIAVIGFFVWGHHLFVPGQSLYAGVVFSLLSYAVAVPLAIKVFNWIGTMHKGFIRFDAPMLYAIGFIGLFTWAA